MYHFFVEQNQINDTSVIITGDDVNHIKNVIRLKIGDEISVSNGTDGKDYRCGIEQITESQVICKLRFIKEDGVELPAKQSKRAVIPQIKQVMTFRQALEYAKDMDVKLVPYEMENILDGSSGMEGTRNIIDHLSGGQQIAIFIGPEGGFEENEINDAIALGMKPVTLGKRILRTETAGMTVMAWIMYRLEE